MSSRAVEPQTVQKGKESKTEWKLLLDLIAIGFSIWSIGAGAGQDSIGLD